MGEPALDREIAGLIRLESAFIDASSMIVMNKSGFLAPVRDELTLVTTPPVAEEAGADAAGIETVAGIAGSGSNDSALVASAAAAGLPVISEDKKILLAADRAGLAYYDALMMLCLLFARGRIDREGYDGFLEALLASSRYAARVVAYGEAIALRIMKNG
jgi:hypothetical protein